ncbi:MAG: DUF1559 domain-containing protein [Planctomycetaceae bacterium]|nr:DUF1559 domain-containing protein [Planctomycetaceae bacterium]
MQSNRSSNSEQNRATPQPDVRRGWAILDAVLVLVTLLLNLIIVLPSIQVARDESRKVQCQANLKVIGSGLHQYHDLHNRLPPGFVLSENGAYTGWSWSTKILPHLGAAELAAKLDGHYQHGLNAVKDHQELRQVIASFRCPTDSGTEYLEDVRVASGAVTDGDVDPSTVNWQRTFPRSTYFGNAGFLHVRNGGIQYNTAGIPTSVAALTNAGSLGHRGEPKTQATQYCDQRHFGGCFAQNSRVGFIDVTDGTSNSLMVGERYSPLVASTEDASTVGHGTWIAVPDCTTSAGLAMAMGDAAVRMNIGMPGREPTTGFGSLHKDGATFLLGDGSVRFLREDIDLEIYRKLSTICDFKR